MRKNVLAFNVELSGVNEFIFSQLKKKGWELNIVNVPGYAPKIDLLKTAISTVRLDSYK